MRLNEELAPFRIYKSIESDILTDGSLDYPDEILAGFDLVIASVHSNLGMDEAKATDRLLAAIRNPYTTVLGHPTGRLLLSRPGYPRRPPPHHRRLRGAWRSAGAQRQPLPFGRGLDVDSLRGRAWRADQHQPRCALGRGLGGCEVRGVGGA